MIDIRDLKTTKDLKSFAKELDPEKDSDIRRFFLLQTITPYFSKMGASSEAKKLFFEKKEDEETLMQKYKISKRLIKDKYLIPRADWNLEDAVGGYTTILNLFNKYIVEIMKHYEPKSDTLVLRSCTARKPYKYTKVQNSLDQFDWAVCSYNIVPKPFNEEYPFAFYCGTEEAEGTTLWERLDNKSQGIINFLEAFPYKNVVDYTRPVYYMPKEQVPSPLDLIKETNPNIGMNFLVYKKPITSPFSLMNYYSKENLFKDFLKDSGILK